MSKKSQIAIFLIFALIFVVAFFYFTFSETKAKEESIKFDLKKIKDDNIVKKTKEYKSYFQICLDSVSQKAVAISGLQGGFIYFDDIGGYHKIFGGSINPDPHITNFTLYRNSLISQEDLKVLVNSFYTVEVPKWNRNLTHTNYSDSLSSTNLLFYNKSVSDDIKRFIEENYVSCIEDISELKNIDYLNYSTNISGDDIEVDFSDNDVFVKLSFPLNIKSESSITHLEDITSIVNVPYKEILDISRSMLREKQHNRSLSFSNILESEVLRNTHSNYISSLIFIEGDLPTPDNSSQKILAFIINNSNFVLGKPFMYQFGYINDAPKITKIVKTSSSPIEKFSPFGDYNNSFELNVSENTPEKFTIYYSDNQPFDNIYNLSGTIVKQNYFNFNEYLNEDNYIKFDNGILEVKINQTIGNQRLDIGDDEVKKTYILNFKVN